MNLLFSFISRAIFTTKSDLWFQWLLLCFVTQQKRIEDKYSTSCMLIMYILNVPISGNELIKSFNPSIQFKYIIGYTNANIRLWWMETWLNTLSSNNSINGCCHVFFFLTDQESKDIMGLLDFNSFNAETWAEVWQWHF